MWTASGRAHGQIRQEGKAIRAAGVVLIMLLVAAGCRHHAKASKQEKSPPSKQADAEQNQIVYTQAGNATGLSQETPKRPLWKIAWNSAELVFPANGNTITKMAGASGTFFQDGKEASTFQSSKAQSVKDSGDVDADGHVVVTSLQYKTTIRCDHIHYTSKGRQLVQATGNVRMDGQWGTLSGLQEVWSTPDLKTFGTPDLFQKR